MFPLTTKAEFDPFILKEKAMILKWRTWFPIPPHKEFYELLQGRAKKRYLLSVVILFDTKDPATSCDSSTNAKTVPTYYHKKRPEKDSIVGCYSLIGKSSRLSSKFGAPRRCSQLSTSTPVTTGNSHPRAELPSEKRFRTQFGPRTSVLVGGDFPLGKRKLPTAKRLTNYK